MSIFASISYANTHPSGTQIVGQVNIIILDQDGNPADGNNCVVGYTQNINGAITNEEVIVFGQSVGIYTGVISDSATHFYTSFTVTGLTVGMTPLDSAVCDLAINTIDVIPQSAAGANDAIITINASTSNGSVTYSINNIDFQDSPTFNNLPGGGGTAYALDQLGCTTQKSYFISTATDLLLQDPSVDLGNGHISRWNAAFNPVYFIFQRKDFAINSVTQAMDGSNNILIDVNTDVSSLKSGIDSGINGVNTHTPGDFVYIKTALYEGSYEVLTVTTNNLVLKCAYTGNDTTGFININALRPYYQIRTQLTYVDPLTNKIKTINVSNRPLTNGHLRADFSSFLQSLLRAKDYSDYTLINYRDPQLSASYQVQYCEVWDGNTPVWRVINNPYYVVYAAKQLGDVGGGNLQQYVPYLNGFQPAKWITEFLNPVYCNGFPFDLAFIFSEYMVGLAPYYHITLLDINKNPLADQSVSDAFLLNEDGSFVLNEDGSKFIIASSDIVNYPIVEHVGLNRLLINFTPPDICWWFKVELKYNSSETPVSIPITLTEATSPHFIDGGLQVKFNSVIPTGGDLAASGSATVTGKVGDIYQFKEHCDTTPTGTTKAQIIMQVIKNSAIIYQKAIPSIAGAIATKTGIIQPASNYSVNVFTEDSATIYPDIDIPDNTTVDPGPQDLMQPIICRVDQNTTDRPVYMRWIGLTGAWNYYKFVYNQVVALEVSDPVISKNFVIDWENEDTIEDVLSKNAGQKMQVFGENVTVDDIKGLQSIKYSPKVQMLISTNPIKWQTVVISAASYTEYETMLKEYSFGLTFNLPSLNIQTQ